MRSVMVEPNRAIPPLFRVRLLGRGDVPPESTGALARAYALVALLDPRLTPGEWAAFIRRCRRQSLHRGGLAVLEDRRGYVHAVFRYAVAVGPPFAAGAGRRRTMWLQDIVLAELPGGAVVRAIATAGESMARAFGCLAAAIELPAAGHAWLRATPFGGLGERGYAVAVGPTLVRPIDP